MKPERVDVPMTLAELPELSIYFHRYLSDRLWNPSGNSFSAHLSYRVGDLVDEEHGIAGCAQLDDSLTASIDGVPISIFTHGRWPEFENQACFEPSIGLHDIPLELQHDGAKLVIADSSRSITAELGNMFVPRTAVPIGSEDWQFQSGEQVVLQWSPAADLTSAHPGVVFLGPTDPPQDHIEFSIDEFTRGTDSLAFTLPADFTGEGKLFIEFAGGDPDMNCGDIPCSLWGGQRAFHDATIAH